MPIKVFAYYANTPKKIIGQFKPMTPGDPGMPDCYSDWFAFTNDFEPTDNLVDVLAQNTRIACIPAFLDVSNLDIEKFQLILVTVTDLEQIPNIENWIAKSKINNYLVALGAVEGYNELPKNYFIRPWYVWQILRDSDLQECQLQSTSYLFESLLGSCKDHRDFVMAYMNKSGLLEKSIITYRENFSSQTFVSDEMNQYIKARNLIVRHPYISPNIQPNWEQRCDTSSGIKAWVVPWDILAHSQYSIVTESYPERAFIMSEKTAKPIVARRLFIMFGPQHYLHHLRHFFGFKTFDGIIDESYDNISNKFERWEAAWDQVEWLAQQDYNSIVKRASTILEYNRNHLLNLQRSICNSMVDVVKQKIQSTI